MLCLLNDIFKFLLMVLRLRLLLLIVFSKYNVIITFASPAWSKTHLQTYLCFNLYNMDLF